MSWLKWRHRKVGQVNLESTLSIGTSECSLADSRLNLALVDMLNLHENKCSPRCKVDPLSWTSRRAKVIRCVTLFLLPFIIMMGMTISNGSKAVNVYFDSKVVYQHLFFGVELGDVIRFLQQERSVNILYTETLTTETRELLLSSYTLTDKAISNLSLWPQTGISEFQSRVTFMAFLNQHRYKLRLSNNTWKDEFVFYTNTINIIFSRLLQEFSTLEISILWENIVSFQSIVSSIKYHGQEQSYGVAFYAHGRFSDMNEYLKYAESRDTGISSLDSAMQYCHQIREMYQRYNEGNDSRLHAITTMRRNIKENSYNQIIPSTEKAKIWMNAMASHLGMIKNMQYTLADTIRRQAKDENLDHLFNVIFSFCLLAATLIVSLLVTMAICNYGSSMQTVTVSLINRTREVRKEKKRTGIILNRTLPMTVAMKVHRKECVDPEEFKTASLMLSQMSGFKQMCMTSSPHHVVATLDKLYGCYDEMINRYGAFKVETMPDVYLITSGLSHRNKWHARDIALLSLDILRHASSLEIPHHPGRTFSLSIGCHTGPIKTGITGTEVPKYCIFGKSVDVASRIQTLSSTNRIHISKEMHDALKDCVNFEMEMRVDDEAKTDWTLRSLLGDPVVTYWLSRNASMVSLTSISSTSTVPDLFNY